MPEYEISTDRHRLDIALIHDFLRSSYWAQDIPRSVVEKSVEYSLCFGVFCDRTQVGFARVVTDFAAIAYLADVFVVPEHRGRGVGKRLIRAVLEHPELQGLRRFILATKDAHGFYASVGFQPLSHPEDFMTIHKPDIYRSRNLA
jgi:GNAT superfamily N-acetyltransferase